ncbi:hypothetical protein KC19_VG093400 [Ceratodon purpureus]|uniref:Uncharacterized protein n=1 Tax=Ceratodon purpureus TaxID=3225 RepID=A0A8T0HNP0_CERPU|nr:hypothetical protein KC19_VG093400 [Ceratodon purpureus]
MARDCINSLYNFVELQLIKVTDKSWCYTKATTVALVVLNRPRFSKKGSGLKAGSMRVDSAKALAVRLSLVLNPTLKGQVFGLGWTISFSRCYV